MAIRDLGYQPYEGDRLPPTNNTQVMLRYGLTRAWSSWLVKIAAFLCWVPPVIAVVLIFVNAKLVEARPDADMIDAPDFIHGLFSVQLWLFLTMITLGAGAGAIAEDMMHRAFQFYFSKPVTRSQYLLGRISAVWIWCFALTIFPAVIVILALFGVAPAEARFERIGLLLPAVIYSALIATVCSAASVAISAMSKSRSLTMSAWMVVFILPHVLASIVEAITEWPWLKMISLPALLDTVGKGLFKIKIEEGSMEWFHALPVLVVIVFGGLFLTRLRLNKAEVIA